jgi:hypothetical protein
MKTNILFLAFTLTVLCACNNKKETEVKEVKTDAVSADAPIEIDTVQYGEYQ